MSIETTLGNNPAVDVERPSPGDLECWSVTTILGVLDKPALLYWSAEEAAWCAIRNERTWKAMLADDGEEAAVTYIRDARLRRPKDRLSDTEFGTRIHALCEEYALTGTAPAATADRFLGDTEAAQQCMVQFDRWLQRFQPEFIASEMTVYSPTFAVAGTSDGIMKVRGTRYIHDFKSSKKSFNKQGQPTSLFPEIALQLSAYRYAEFAAPWHARRYEKFRRRYYLLNEAERAAAVPVPEVDTGLGIKITPEHCTAYEVRCDQAIYETFLYLIEAARWKFEVERTVIGAPLDEEIG